MTVRAVMFDFSGTLFRLEEDDTWFADIKVDEFVLSFEVGAVKPNPEIFQTALARLGVRADDALMVGDSDEADGGARALGCRFALVDPLPTDQRPTGVLDALASAGVAL